MVELTVLGISLEEEGSTPVLLLHPHGTRRVLSLHIGPMEAFAISMALHEADANNDRTEAERKPPPAAGDQLPSAAHRELPLTDSAAPTFPRPLTHDLLLNVIKALGSTLAAVDLMDISAGTFFARAILQQSGRTIHVDCRPSDGVALALRCGAVIRASDKVVAQAESIDLVMAGLPEHVRALAAAQLAMRSGAPSLPDRARIPPAIEEALAAKAKFSEAEQKEEPVSAARTRIEEKSAARNARSVTVQRNKAAPLAPEKPASRNAEPPSQKKEKAEAPVKKISIQPRVVFIGPDGEKSDAPPDGMPRIRVTMVRHGSKGEAEIINQFNVPAGGIPHEVLASLGLSRREAEAVNSAGDEERWATLLRLLSPETKVPM